MLQPEVFTSTIITYMAKTSLNRDQLHTPTSGTNARKMGNEERVIKYSPTNSPFSSRAILASSSAYKGFEFHQVQNNFCF